MWSEPYFFFFEFFRCSRPVRAILWHRLFGPLRHVPTMAPLRDHPFGL